MILQLRRGPDTAWVADHYGVPLLAAAWRVKAVPNPRQSLVGMADVLYWEAVSAAY